ncbi:hypothetical protein LIS82_06825 [Cytobacillus solani]|uniref:Uncharacterized protein n=1 Tax=Cytobacillus solani TaxID=1637975 RepID=A0A0Q3VG12_9BACI|nr:hypothetical protein [Cytobacillus solani]KOP81325.1 hypothetical protein AMS60_01745 [Bacillus sp. FJAT-21945]KQL18339.1 hypothetical protein AN957_06935 [Cytobacillus solani]USK56190.1 hypothetical protein LIS82_06825 [Cytobacillus solani]
MKRIIIFLLSLLVLLVGGYVLISSEVLKIDEDRDIIKYDGRIYSNATDLEWFDEEKNRFQKGQKIGEIKRQKDTSILWGNFTANKLVKGTALYGTHTGKGGIIIVEKDNGELLYYLEQIKE